MSNCLVAYPRVVLKITGEALGKNGEFGIDMEQGRFLVEEILDAYALGAQIAIVVGGGNLVRGVDLQKHGLDPILSDHAGMLATAINALIIEGLLKNSGMEKVRVMTAIEMKQVTEPVLHKKAAKHLEDGFIVIFGCGTGNPGFSTDSAAVLRAHEIRADIVLKATKVNGVYDSDPQKNSDAKQFDFNELTFDKVMSDRLNVMDAAAFAYAREHGIPILIFNLFQKGNLRKVLLGEKIGNKIS